MQKIMYVPKRTLAALLACGLSIALVAPAQAADADGIPLAPGDVLAGTGAGQVKHFSPGGKPLDTLDTTTGSNFTTGMCFNSSGDLFVTNFSSSTISEFDRGGNLLKATWATLPTSPAEISPESCTIDASDHMYVGNPNSPTPTIYEFNTSGTQINSFAVTGGSGTGGTDWLDLAADQCTILYTGEGSEILSYNACFDTQEPALTTSLPAPCFELRIRPNGEVMVACASEVVRLDSTGNVLQTYHVPGSSSLFSMSLDPDNSSFWTGDSSNGEVFQLEIASGSVVRSFNSSPTVQLLGLAIVGGIVVSQQPTLTLTPPTATGTVGTSNTVTATITNPGGSVSGQLVSFGVKGANTASGTGTTNTSGQASFTYTGTNAGTDAITASFTNEGGATATGKASVNWVPPTTATTLTVHPGTGDFADLTRVSAKLTNSSGPVAGKTVTLTLNGSETCPGTTDATGIASCPITPGESAGSYTLAGSFAGDSMNLASSGSANFVVTHEETALFYTGPASALNGQPFTFSGHITTDDPTADTALGGETLTFTLGTGSGAQTCAGTTNSTGTASCTIASVSQPVGSSVPVAASFAGDDFYVPATAKTTAAVFAPAPFGAFAIGDQSAGNPTVGAPVNFWGSRWAQSNSLSGGTAPSSMKGFVANSTALFCGSNWTARTGNSSAPPGTLPDQIEVMVSTNITQAGSTLRGDIVHIVIVRADPGYRSAPGHPGTGQIIAVIC
jgi:hypothetical protein